MEKNYLLNIIREFTVSFYGVFLLFTSPVSAGEKVNHRMPGKYAPAIIIKTAVTNDAVSTEWKDALRSRMSKERIDSFGRIKRPLTDDEIAWKNLIESKAGAWNTFRDSLAVPFKNILLNDTIFVMLGFLGDDDGFTYEKRTVCFDLTALNRVYGKAGLPENSGRMDRIFAHEYTHLLHKSWAGKTNYTTRTFKDEILWECLYEGMGMYRSLNNSWLPVHDSLPAVTMSALDNLYPVFVDRMIAVETNPRLSDTQKEKLHENLSRGSVNKKWGAFPVAIWLLLEAKGDEGNLIKWIDKGPVAVIQLAKKYLPGELQKRFTSVFLD